MHVPGQPMAQLLLDPGIAPVIAPVLRRCLQVQQQSLLQVQQQSLQVVLRPVTSQLRLPQALAQPPLV